MNILISIVVIHTLFVASTVTICNMHCYHNKVMRHVLRLFAICLVVIHLLQCGLVVIPLLLLLYCDYFNMPCSNTLTVMWLELLLFVTCLVVIHSNVTCTVTICNMPCSHTYNII